MAVGAKHRPAIWRSSPLVCSPQLSWIWLWTIDKRQLDLLHFCLIGKLVFHAVSALFNLFSCRKDVKVTHRKDGHRCPLWIQSVFVKQKLSWIWMLRFLLIHVPVCSDNNYTGAYNIKCDNYYLSKHMPMVAFFCCSIVDLDDVVTTYPWPWVASRTTTQEPME